MLTQVTLDATVLLATIQGSVGVEEQCHATHTLC